MEDRYTKWLEDLDLLEIDCSLGIHSKLEAADQFILYPNPTSGTINIVCESGQRIKTIELYDAKGAHLKQMGFDGAAHVDMHFNDLPKGIYSLLINSNSTIRFVKR